MLVLVFSGAPGSRGKRVNDPGVLMGEVERLTITDGEWTYLERGVPVSKRAPGEGDLLKGTATAPGHAIGINGPG